MRCVYIFVSGAIRLFTQRKCGVAWQLLKKFDSRNKLCASVCVMMCVLLLTTRERTLRTAVDQCKK